MPKIIHILPHNIESFMAGNYDNFDHHSIRFMEKINNFSNGEIEQELWTFSKKRISAEVIHQKGFYVRLFPVSLKLPFPLEISFSLLKEVIKNKEKNVVWHLHSYHLLTNSLVLPIILKIKRQKFIIHFHGGGPNFQNIKSAIYSIFQYLLNLRISLNLANFVIVLNHNEEKRVDNFLWVKKEKIFYFPNTIPRIQCSEVQPLNTNTQSFEVEPQKPESQIFKMVYAGRTEKISQDAFLMLEKTLLENRDCILEIIGLKEKNQLLENLENKFPSQIILTGWLKKEELLKKFQEMDIFTHLYFGNEGSPITLIEALSQGLAVLAFDKEGTRDAVKNNYNGWLVRDFKEYEQKLNEILRNRKITGLLKNNCVNSVKESFADEKYFPQLLDIYYSLIYS